MTDFRDRRVMVVGLGVSGLATARVLNRLGARVIVTERATSAAIEERADRLRSEGVEVETNGHDLTNLDVDLAVVSPGVPPHTPLVRALRDRGTPVVGEVELAARMAQCDFLAVTGTNGKTTTTTLLGAMLAEGGLRSVVAGNIGLPLIEAVRMVPAGGAIAVEVSSFQLETIETFAPRVAVVLNVAPDHLDWHGTFDAYLEAKARIVANQGPADVFLPNFEDGYAMKIAARADARIVPFSAQRVPTGGIGIEGSTIVWRDVVIDIGDGAPMTSAVLEDVVAAAGAALAFGIDPSAVERAIRAFRALPHRLETVAEIDGVSYVDDSKATNPHATLAAVRGLHDVVLIAGGRSKGIDLSPLASTVPPVRAVVAIGEATDEVVRVFDGRVPVVRAASMRDAVAAARDLAGSGAWVLLSPGCASLDMYPGYAARGDDFVRAVNELRAGSTGGADGRPE